MRQVQRRGGAFRRGNLRKMRTRKKTGTKRREKYGLPLSGETLMRQGEKRKEKPKEKGGKKGREEGEKGEVIDTKTKEDCEKRIYQVQDPYSRTP